jgi:hypothetical protein
LTEDPRFRERRLAAVGTDARADEAAAGATALRPRMRHGHRPGLDDTGPCRSDNDCADDEICFGGNCT